MEDNLYKDLLVELECPICSLYMSPPIRQCATGHSICENCRRKLPKCGLCQGVFTESRNISLEGLAIKMRYPCINKNYGCNIKLAYNEKEIHESQCTSMGYECAMDGCSWVGKLEDISRHWASKQMPNKPYGANNVCQIKISPEGYYVNIIEAHDKLFWFKCKSSKKKLYWVVQYIGKSSEAENYWYEIDIFKSDRPKHKILLSRYCQPVKADNSVFDGSCISLPSNMVQSFLKENQLLVYNMRVHVIKANKAEAATSSNFNSNKKTKTQIEGAQKNKVKQND